MRPHQPKFYNHSMSFNSVGVRFTGLVLGNTMQNYARIMALNDRFPTQHHGEYK